MGAEKIYIGAVADKVSTSWRMKSREGIEASLTACWRPCTSSRPLGTRLFPPSSRCSRIAPNTPATRPVFGQGSASQQTCKRRVFCCPRGTAACPRDKRRLCAPADPPLSKSNEDPQFEGVEITQAEFEGLWQKFVGPEADEPSCSIPIAAGGLPTGPLHRTRGRRASIRHAQQGHRARGALARTHPTASRRDRPPSDDLG